MTLSPAHPRVYLDASVLLRWAFGEPDPLEALVTAPCTSAIAEVECRRTVHRALHRHRVTPEAAAEILSRLDRLLQMLDIVELDGRVLQRASGPMPTPVGTLDALHLASALRLNEAGQLRAFATHDHELALCARLCGIEVWS